MTNQNTNDQELSQDNIMTTTLPNLLKFKLIKNSKSPACKWKNKKFWSKNHPVGNYGIPTGEANNIFVLDLDFYKIDTEDELFANPFIQMFGEGPTFETFTVASPSGGLHYYFTYDEDIKQTACDRMHIDTRSNGGYIVGPGSTINNEEYKIINDTKITPMPNYLKNWMMEHLFAGKNGETKPGVQIQRSESLYTYSFTDDLLRRIFDGLPEEYWTTYQGSDGEPSFLIWTTACKILGCSDLWDEYNRQHNCKKYNYNKNVGVWNGCKRDPHITTSWVEDANEYQWQYEHVKNNPDCDAVPKPS
eukprot:COSAG06_NODE_2584_length_6617_cov_9.409021_2_plen_304_part_00